MNKCAGTIVPTGRMRSPLLDDNTLDSSHERTLVKSLFDRQSIGRSRTVLPGKLSAVFPPLQVLRCGAGEKCGQSTSPLGRGGTGRLDFRTNSRGSRRHEISRSGRRTRSGRVRVSNLVSSRTDGLKKKGQQKSSFYLASGRRRVVAFGLSGDMHAELFIFSSSNWQTQFQ